MQQVQSVGAQERAKRIGLQSNVLVTVVQESCSNYQTFCFIAASIFVHTWGTCG